MAQDQVSGDDAPSLDHPPLDIQGPRELEDVTLPTPYEMLMKQHRDAILRIHTLETENQNLMNLLKQSLSGNAFSFVDQAANPTELLSRIQALEGREESASEQSGNDHDSNVSAKSDEANRASNREIAELRVQNQTLVGQVSKMDGELQAIKGERSRRRRRKSSRNQKQGLLKRLFGG